jgi:hypothetical protein
MAMEIPFNPGGNYFAAVFLSLGPVVILLFARWQRKKNKGTALWEVAKRWGYAPIWIPALIYFGLIYWWLFQDQFYRILIMEDATWHLKYPVPPRTQILAAGDIDRIETYTGDYRTFKMVRIVITTWDRKRFVSAQISSTAAAHYAKLLQEIRDK